MYATYKETSDRWCKISCAGIALPVMVETVHSIEINVETIVQLVKLRRTRQILHSFKRLGQQLNQGVGVPINHSWGEMELGKGQGESFSKHSKHLS